METADESSVYNFYWTIDESPGRGMETADESSLPFSLFSFERLAVSHDLLLKSRGATYFL